MGERCYMNVKCPEHQAGAISEILGSEPSENSKDQGYFYADGVHNIDPPGKLPVEESPPDVRTVPCKFCCQPVVTTDAYRHNCGWVGECCWDERLRSTE